MNIFMPRGALGSVSTIIAELLRDALIATTTERALEELRELARESARWQRTTFSSHQYNAAKALAAALVAAMPREQLVQLSLEEIHARVLSVCALLDIRVET